MRRWVGPWLWATVQALIIVSGVTIAVDLRRWVDFIDPQHTEINSDRLGNVPTNAVYYTIFAAVISAIIALSRVSSLPNAVRVPLGMEEERPRLLRNSRRGKIYAAYVPIDVAVASAIIATNHRLISPNTTLHPLDDWQTWAVLGLVAVGGFVIFIAFIAVTNWWFDRR